MAGTGFAETTPYGNLECGKAKSGRRDLMGSQGKAKFGKRHGSRKWEEENSSTRRRHRGKGRKRQKTPSPPYNVPHTPLGIRRAGCFLLFCISETPEMHPRPFLGVFGIRSGPSQGFSRIRRGIRRHPRVRWQICESKGLLFGPCLPTLLPSRNRKGLKPFILIYIFLLAISSRKLYASKHGAF